MSRPLDYFAAPGHSKLNKSIIVALLVVSVSTSILILRSQQKPSPALAPTMSPPVLTTLPSSFFLIWHSSDLRDAVQTFPTTAPSMEPTVPN